MIQTIFTHLDLTELEQDLQDFTESTYHKKEYEFSTPDGLTVIANVEVDVQFSRNNWIGSYSLDSLECAVYVDPSYRYFENGEEYTKFFGEGFSNEECRKLELLIKDEILLQF